MTEVAITVVEVVTEVAVTESPTQVVVSPGAPADPVGHAEALVDAHEMASDPHPQYQTQAEGDARYSQLGHTHAIAIIDVTGLTSALAGKIDTSSKNAANGVAGLDGSGKLNPSTLPALAITDTFMVASQAAMLATGADVGDVAIRSDVNKTFILRATPASTLGNWSEILTPTSAVSSVFGRVGAITAQANDYTFAQIGSKPTTLAGYGITDAYKQGDIARFNDVYADRGNGTGAVFLNGAGTRYLHFDGANYILNGAPLWVNGAPVWTSGNFDPATKLGATAKAADATLLDGMASNRFPFGINASATTSVADMNMPTKSGFYERNPGGGVQNSANGVDAWNWFFHVEHTGLSGYGFQFSNIIGTNEVYVRGKQAGSYFGWDKLLHTGNTPAWSAAHSASTLVQRTVNGYVFANYFNCTADVTGATASHIAVQTGDGYIRWRAPASLRSDIGAVANVAGVNAIYKLTQAAYNAIGTKDANTLYVIVG